MKIVDYTMQGSIDLYKRNGNPYRSKSVKNRPNILIQKIFKISNYCLQPRLFQPWVFKCQACTGLDQDYAGVDKVACNIFIHVSDNAVFRKCFGITWGQAMLFQKSKESCHTSRMPLILKKYENLWSQKKISMFSRNIRFFGRFIIWLR